MSKLMEQFLETNQYQTADGAEFSDTSPVVDEEDDELE